ncbi:1-hydroxycarotenoid 3,4-desaturase CrtD [Meridianimarinicoccus sp. RP-17]|uniref:1-hydroxycarotenoid 3,4-desaturase CrtD n=1 Tax=Meridianimarinicoccus zhengii TaxID=2056810 RepID=UPI000DACE7DE|nr:1-hydroxycarotenoid 3,4-desaturase CrtD [Phycocomes zhengii]
MNQTLRQDGAPRAERPVIVIGAGIGGLAAALRLAAAGVPVTVFDRAAGPGGKMRTVPSAAGPVDAGPTVLTMRAVFDDLFCAAGARIEDHVTLHRQDILARHWWPDGSTLDLHADPGARADAIRSFAGAQAAREFCQFSARAARLFDAFDEPMMQTAQPSLGALTRRVMREPALIPLMAPNRTLAQMLAGQFSDPRLAQLFGRYATYVGGSPYQAPALLALIWQAEAAGVWVVDGGMHALARAIAGLAGARGAVFRYGAEVDEITRDGTGRASGVRLADGETVPAAAVLFNGDPRALGLGLLGQSVRTAGNGPLRAERSLSARVWTFAAQPDGPLARSTATGGLAHHNVFFGGDPEAEFADLRAGRMPRDATLYVCAEDRGKPAPPDAMERFEIIMNAAPLTARTGATGAAQGPDGPEEQDPCHTRTFATLARFGLSFDPVPGLPALTTPSEFERLFPGSAGSLYGQSPHGLTAALSRPTARSAVAGLYLAGGGTHPGAGVPMAAISGRHAAEAIVTDLGSISPSRRTAMPGGMSTG